MLKTLKTLHKGLGTPNRAGKSYPQATSMASSGRSSLPFARRYTLQTLQACRFRGPHRFSGKISGTPNPAGRTPPRPDQSLLLGIQACRLPAFASFKRYPKARSMASSRRSSLPFTTFLLHNAVLHRKLVPTDRSMVYLPRLHVTGHIPFASGANVNIRFLLHNAVLHRKLVPTDPSMVYLPCLQVTGHIPFASGANVNMRFFLHNAVLHRKLVPTHRSMVYLPRLHVTGQIPFASGANVNIRFLLHNAVLHRKLVPTDPSMVYLPCLHVTGHIPFASGANVNIRFFLHNAVLHLDMAMCFFDCLTQSGSSTMYRKMPHVSLLHCPILQYIATNCSINNRYTVAFHCFAWFESWMVKVPPCSER